MNPAEERVYDLIRYCAAREIDAACDVLTADVRYDNVPIGVVEGRSAVRSVLTAGVMAAATQVEWLVHRQIAVGDVVMHERTDRFLVDGRWISIPIASVFEVRDDGICLWRDYFDLQTYRSQRSG
jgi:limonene-1,2-epoxide hydrolase